MGKAHTEEIFLITIEKAPPSCYDISIHGGGFMKKLLCLLTALLLLWAGALAEEGSFLVTDE